MRVLVTVVVLWAAAGASAAKVSVHISPTEPLSPRQEREKFHLPDGFEIQLFAAEPDIQKPINMAFDARGRLWVSGSIEYPFRAEPGKGRDAVRVLEDTDGDGRADNITTFADGLNIPIGLYPYRNGVVVYSIPNIYFLQDEDGDGRADRREVLYGPLGDPVDTHGLQNAFRRGFDGWLYICHGYRNTSTIKGRDGSEIHLTSGNTYRVRLDGSRVETFAHGQVNPFGATWMPTGELVTADCHSKPLSLLLRGGCYESFGRPHDGLGFVPPIMHHLHGSTALCGAAYFAGGQQSAASGESLLVGNVTPGRVHRDAIEFQEATMSIRRQADFVVCDDPWFRPVDIQVGPDGAIYVADFYNRIIGHYEVPLDHPGRDRSRGRIWRIVWKGSAARAAAGSAGPPGLAEASVEDLIEALGDPILTRRMLAMDQLSDRCGSASVEPLRQAIQSTSSAYVKAHGLWVLHRLHAVRPDEIAAAAVDPAMLVRIHALGLLAEADSWPDALQALARAGLKDAEPRVRRAAADALGQHADPRSVGPLLGALRRTPPADRHLSQGIRIALRNQLRVPAVIRQVAGSTWSDSDRRALADVAVAVPNQEAAAMSVRFLNLAPADEQLSQRRLQHIATYTPLDLMPQVVALVRRGTRDIESQLRFLEAIQQRLERRGVERSDSIIDWGAALADQLLGSIDSASAGWSNRSADNPWDLEKRRCDDEREAVFLSSLPGGERQTAVLRTRPFEIPPRLRFYLCGHQGKPGDPPAERNYVCLRLAGSGEVLKKQFPPRRDTAERVDWDLRFWAGRQGYLEVVDGLDLDAFAWLAVARFEPAVASVPALGPRTVARRRMAVAEIARTLALASLEVPLRRLLADDFTDFPVRAAAAAALLAIKPDPVAAGLIRPLADPSVDADLRHAAAQAIASGDRQALLAVCRQVMRTVPTPMQQQVAEDLAATASGSGLLLDLVEQGVASARLLQRPSLIQKLSATNLQQVDRRVARLTESLPAIDQQIAARIKTCVDGFAAAGAVAERGALVFDKNCRICHQVQEKGALIGPQLDGIGNRGLERIVEDVLDPNRNVDASFHVSVLALTDGRVRTGIFRRRDGQALVFAGNDGKEFHVPEVDVEAARKSPLSLMPDNLAESLPLEARYDLFAFLLSLRRDPP